MTGGRVNLVQTARGVVTESRKDDVMGMAAELSYRFFLAVFPFAIMVGALSGFVADLFGIQDPAHRIVNSLSSSFPSDTTGVLERQLNDVITSRNVSLISFGLIGAIWASAGGISSLIKALNRAYDVPETRPWWRRTLLSVALTISAGFALILAFLSLVTIQVWGWDIANKVGLQTAFGWFIKVGGWLVPFLLIMLAVSLLYWLAPNVEQKFRFVSAGTVLFAASWAAATWLFSLYVTNVASYNATYGTLGGIVVLLLWFYLTSMMLLAGAELNALLDAQLDPETTRRRREKVMRQKGAAAPTAKPERPNGGLRREPPAEAVAPAPEPEGGGLTAGPLVALVGVFAAMFAIRRLVR